MVKRVAHNQIPVPDFFDIFGDELTGEISITRNFDDHPDAQVSVLVGKDRIDYIRDRFKDNFEEKFSLYEIPFRLRTYTEEEQPFSVYPEGRYKITLDFEGYWRALADRAIKLRDDSREQGLNVSGVSTAWSDPSCAIKSTGSGSTALPTSVESVELSGASHPYKENVDITYISELATRAGVPLTGGDSLFIEYPTNTSYSATTTLADAIGRKFITEDLIVCWSTEEPRAVVFGDAKTNDVTPDEIIAPITYNKPTEPVAYRDTELNWDKFGREQADLEKRALDLEEIEENQVTNVPAFERIPQNTFTVEGGDLDYQEVPQGYQFLNSYTLNWDISGPTKVYKTTTYQGSAIVKESEQTWGFAFTIQDINANFYTAASFAWKQVQQIDTTYNYDANTGYLLGSDSTGWLLGRYRVESYSENDPDAYQTLKFQGTPGIIEVFGFQSFPIKNFTRYELHQFSDYYNDSAQLSDQYVVYEYCTRAGRRARGYVLDPTYIPDMFAKRTVEFQSAYSTRDNPFDNSSTAEPMTFGRESFLRENIQIYNSATTVSTFELLGDSAPDGPDRYRTFVVEVNSEDYNFQNNTNNTRMVESSGRPATAQGIGSPYQLKRIDFSGDGAGVPEYTIERKKLEKKQRSLNRRIQTTYLMTSNKSENARGGGSISVETDEEEIALRTAGTLLEIQRFRQEETTNLVTHFNPQFKEGEFLEFTYNGNTYKRRILRSTSVIKIVGTTVIGEELVLTGASSFTLGPADTDTEIVVQKFDPQGNEIDDDHIPYRDDGILDVSLPPQRRGLVLGEFDLAIFISGRGGPNG